MWANRSWSPSLVSTFRSRSVSSRTSVSRSGIVGASGGVIGALPGGSWASAVAVGAGTAVHGSRIDGSLAGVRSRVDGSLANARSLRLQQLEAVAEGIVDVGLLVAVEAVTVTDLDAGIRTPAGE